jgi:hypothetical protein
MAIDMMPVISEEESKRRAQIHARLDRDYRVKTRSRLRRMIFTGVRRTFIFLLGAAIVTFIVAHRNQIDYVATQKVSRVVAHLQTKADTTDPLRQSALDHEKEVEEVVGK